MRAHHMLPDAARSDLQHPPLTNMKFVYFSLSSVPEDKARYTTRIMADDALAVMDALGWVRPARLLVVGMGGWGEKGGGEVRARGG